MKVSKFLLVASSISGKLVEKIIEEGRPEKVCGIETPVDLSGLSLGELIRLQNIRVESMSEILFLPSEIVMKLSERSLYKAEAETLLRFSFWCLNEVKKITEMFGKTGVKPTPEELEAGINRITSDSFTLVDYYALRMGYQDHAEAEKVPWVRVYRCYKADAEGKEFERRLYKVINKKR